MSHHPHLLLLLIILVGAVFRFGWPGIHSFSFDEARVSQIALKMVYEGEFARLGMQSSVGVPNFPATVWLYAIPFLIFGPNVQLATWFTGLASLLAIPAAFQLGRWRWGVWGGLSAALIFALSPFMLVYGRNIWSQNFLAPLTVFWLYAGYKGISPLVSPQPAIATEQEGKIALACFIFLGGFIGQVHIAGVSNGTAHSLHLFSALSSGAESGPSLLGGWRPLCAPSPHFTPSGVFGDGARADLDSALAEPSIWHHEVWRMMVQLPLNKGWEFVWLGRDYAWPQPLGMAAELAYWVLVMFATLALGLVIQQMVKWFRGEVKAADSLWLNLVLGSMLATPLLFWYSGSDVAIHYILPAFPGGILLLAGMGEYRPHKLRGTEASGYDLFCYFFGRMWRVCASTDPRAKPHQH